jgi:diguanylate cyclase (GGDEF)-like protein
MSFLYICYCDLKIGTMPGRNKRLHMLYAAPLLINLVLALISVRSGWLFSIGLDNVYRRGSALAVSFLLSYVLLGVAFVRVLYYRKKLRAEAGGGPAGYRYGGTLALLLFPLSPLIGGLIQIANPPMTVVWLSTVFALLVLYISVQNAEIVTDPLTGLYNRRQTDSYLQGLIQGTPRAGGIRLAILDVDNFKQINDRYGHLTGDRALRTLASVLRSECARDTFCSRYGGDEFVIVTRHGGRDQLEALLARIDERLDECCGTLGEQFRLSISVGAAAWSAHTDTADTLFAAADKELYLNKRKLKRRATDQDEG